MPASTHKPRHEPKPIKENIIMSRLSETIERKNSYLADCTMLVQAGLKTPEQKEEYRTLLEKVDDADEMISMLKRVENVLPKSAPAATPPATSRGGRESKKTRRAKINATFRAYLQGQNTPEVRALVENTDANGGAAVPQEFSSILTEALKLYAPLMSYANTKISTRSVKVSTVDDTANGLTLISEGTTLAETDPTFASVLVDRDILSAGIIKFAKELLSDSAFDLEDVLTRLISSRIGRGAEKAITLGKDVAGTTLPNNPGLINLAQIATTTGAIASGIGWTDLTNTFDALDPAYLPRSIWQMSSKTRNYLSSLKTSDGRPYFTPATDGGMDYLLGRPIVINQSLPSPTAGVFSASAKPILFGSLYDSVQIVTSDLRVQTLHERFADVNLSALTAYTRIGSASLQAGAGALQALKIAAA
jgi:HK97 family phage major capsid protein